jgi:hypothetical protein
MVVTGLCLFLGISRFQSTAFGAFGYYLVLGLRAR